MLMCMKDIVVGLDGSAASLHALEWAANEAAERACRLLLVSAYHVPSYGNPAMGDAYISASLGEAIRKDHDEILQRGVTHLQPGHSGLRVETVCMQGGAASCLVEASTDAELLVVGSHGVTGLIRNVIGSTATAVAHRAACSVIVVPSDRAQPPAVPPKVIAVGIDGSPGSHAALMWAYDVAARHDAQLIAVHAWNYPYVRYRGSVAEAVEWVRNDADEELRTAVKQLFDDPKFKPGAVNIEQRLIDLGAAEALAAVSNEADLLVVGTRGRGTLATLLLGSISRRVVEFSQCPVGIIREHAT
jgi:nucleotide-binding universal stress UspA family protein